MDTSSVGVIESRRTWKLYFAKLEDKDCECCSSLFRLIFIAFLYWMSFVFCHFIAYLEIVLGRIVVLPNVAFCLKSYINACMMQLNNISHLGSVNCFFNMYTHQKLRCSCCLKAPVKTHICYSFFSNFCSTFAEIWRANRLVYYFAVWLKCLKISTSAQWICTTARVLWWSVSIVPELFSVDVQKDINSTTPLWPVKV